ncbi:MAG: BrnT family toxin [Deltaproteobacteria bacterium]|nr:BrnT family toxin [Deltaproteobacteria bacterium]
MLFIWDPHKAQSNIKKHKVSFELAQSVFDDPLHLSVLDKKTTHEERWITVGISAQFNTLVVVHSYIDHSSGTEIIRIISARKATRREVIQYEKRI